MSWASQPTSEMPANPSSRPGRWRWVASRVIVTPVATGALAALVIGAMFSPSLFGWPPPAEPTAPQAALPMEPATGGTQPAGGSGPATVPSTAPTWTGSAAASLESEVVALTNAKRTELGCPTLRLDPNLATAARAHSTEMAQTGVFGHTGPDGIDPGERLRRAGYDIGGGWAENIALGQPTARAVMVAWLGSPQHRSNILDCSLRAIGVGAARDASGRVFWTQDFGGR